MELEPLFLSVQDEDHMIVFVFAFLCSTPVHIFRRLWANHFSHDPSIIILSSRLEKTGHHNRQHDVRCLVKYRILG